jgi:hypothetical protein
MHQHCTSITITQDVVVSSIVSINSNSPLNQGQTLTIDASVTGGSLPLTYTWTGPNSFSGSTEDISIPNAQPANSGTYSLVVQGATVVPLFLRLM